MDILAKRIREARLARGLSQAALAEKVGYTTRASINKIELGKVDVPRSKIEAIAKALNVSPVWLLGISEEGGLGNAEDRELLMLISRATPEEKQATEQYLRMLIYARGLKKEAKDDPEEN